MLLFNRKHENPSLGLFLQCQSVNLLDLVRIFSMQTCPILANLRSLNESPVLNHGEVNLRTMPRPLLIYIFTWTKYDDC